MSVRRAVLAKIRAALGSLDQARKIVKVVTTVNAAPGFTELPQMANDWQARPFGHRRRGASEASPSAGLSPADMTAIRATSERWVAAVRAGRWADAAATWLGDTSTSV